MQPLMQHSAMRSLLLVLALIGGFIAPGHAETADPGYPLRGVVTRKLEEKKLVLVQHQEIPGFMRAMTMAFSVPDDVWPQLAPGMHLTATLHGSRGNWQLSQVTLTDANFEPLPPPPKDDYPVKITALTAPATTGSEGSTITRGADGSIWLSWLQNDGEDLTSLQLARYEPAAQTWGAARTVARGPDWFVNWADFPALAVEANGRLTAVWFINNPLPMHRPTTTPTTAQATRLGSAAALTKAAHGPPRRGSRRRVRPLSLCRCNPFTARASSPCGSTVAPNAAEKKRPNNSTAACSAATNPIS